MRVYFKRFLITLLIPLALSCAPKNAPDLILLNGKIWTGESESSFKEAIAIKGNLIVATGTSDSIRSLADSKTQVIDLAGKLVTAGFNDAHIHFLSGSKGLAEVNMLGTTTPEEVVARVNEFAAQNPSQQWITGRGWQYTSFKNGLPDFESMKGIITDRPVLIRAYDGHSAWANKKALELAGIDRKTVYTGFGELVKDKNGELTGALKESARELISKHIPLATRSEKLEALRKGLKLSASLGITSVQDAGIDKEDLSLYKELLQNNELTLRYAAAFWVDQSTTEADMAAFLTLKG